MGNPDIETAPARVSEDAGSLKAPTKVGRAELADITLPHESYVKISPSTLYFESSLISDFRYEGRHRFDPEAKWTAAEERRVVWKTDLRLLSWLCLMMFGLQLDRGNLSNALADNLLNDLNLTSDDYNNGTTIQLVCFLAAEFPVQVVNIMANAQTSANMVLSFSLSVMASSGSFHR